MSYILKQAYQKVIREVDRIEQKNKIETRYIYLYEDKVTTKYRVFPMRDLLDISFKQMQDNEGMLFLHTNHGVYSYHVLSSPEMFIEKCKDYIKA